MLGGGDLTVFYVTILGGLYIEGLIFGILRYVSLGWRDRLVTR